MAERTRRAGADPDNWFDPADEWNPQRRDGRSRAAVAEPLPDVAENWLDEPEEIEHDPWRRLGELARRPQVAAAAALVVALFVGLAVAGVFSGGSAPPAPRVTTTSSATVSTPTTTTPAVKRVSPPTTSLAPGATGPEVQALQRALESLGYTVGKVDGVYGKATTDALSAFQAKAGLKADGVLGPLTLQALTTALAP